MKWIAIFLLTFLVFPASFAQSYEAKAEVQRKNHVAAVIELPYPPDEVEDAIKDYMAKKGFKANASKGVQTFKSVKLHQMNTQNQDIHFKVERKSRKEKESSLVHLIVSKEGESLSQRLPDDRASIEDAKAFLNDMVPHFEAYDLEVQIVSQDKTVVKAEKKMNDLLEDQQDLEKKIKSLQEKLEQNKKEQALQKVEVANQKSILEGMRTRRKL